MLLPRIPLPHPARLVLALVVTLGVAVLAAACALSITPGNVAMPALTRSPATADASVDPALDAWYRRPAETGIELPTARGGVLRYSTLGSPPNLDPHASVTDPNWAAIFLNVYDPLVTRRLTPNVEPLDAPIVCRLCRRWSVDDSLTRFSFELRPDVRWHDGQPLTALDVATSLERAADRNRRWGHVTARLDRFAGVTTDGPLSVTITTRSPAPDFLASLETVMILPHHVLEADEGALRGIAVGSGPWHVASWDTRSIVLEPAPAYALPGRPWLDRIEIIHSLNRAGRQAAFLAGEIDLTTARDRAELDALLRGRPSAGYQSWLTGAAFAIAPNANRPPWNDPALRRALTQSIDREQLAQQVAGADGRAFIPPASAIGQAWALGSAELATRSELAVLPPDQRARLVRQQLAAAGFPDGLRSGLMVWNAEPAPGMARAIVPMARAGGIDLDVQVIDSGTAQKRLVGQAFDLALRPFFNPLAPAHYAGFLGGAPENYWGIADPALDDLIRAQAIEGDTALRYEQRRELQRRLLDQAWLLPLVDTTAFAVWQADVRNFRNHARGTQPYPLVGVSETIWKQPQPGP